MSTPNLQHTTTSADIPVESDGHSLTVGPAGAILPQDHCLTERMARFNRERVPERVAHAKASGAYGRFEVANDVSRFTEAGLFQPGRSTRIPVRFSTVAGEQGSPGSGRGPRGLAAPNSYGGPAAFPQAYGDIPGRQAAGETVRGAYTPQREDDGFGPPGTMVREVLDDAARGRPVSNVAGHRKDG